MRHLLHAATALFLALASTGCTEGEASRASRPSPTPSPTVTAPPPATAEEAVEALVAAWQDGDRQAAARAADPAAIDALFAHEPLPVELVACLTGPALTTCEVVDERRRSLELGVRLVRAGPRVVSAAFVGGEAELPGDPDAYAAALVDAWAAWDRDLALRYATAETVDRLFGFDSADGWALVATEGAAGTSYPIYEDEQGRRIALSVSNAAVSERRTQAVTRVLLPGDEG